MLSRHAPLVMLLAACLACQAQATQPEFERDPILTVFEPSNPQACFEGGVFPGTEPPPGLQPGMPYHDFTVQPPPRMFPDCRLPLLSWRVGPGPECSPYGPNGELLVPAHAVRVARWYVAADLVALRRDSREEQVFARLGNGGDGAIRLSSQDFDYPLDAGGQLMIGRRLTERTSFEATYLGSYDWRASTAIRDDAPFLIGGGGNGTLSSPFSGFGDPPEQGLDFNNLVSAETQSNLESVELQFRYRPDMPYGAYDVSFLYGIRYLHIDDTLAYHSESQLPAGRGAINDYTVATDNDMIGAQLGITNHFLILPAFWIDWDVKGAFYNNHARQRTVFTSDDGAQTSFANDGARDDTAFSLDVRIISNFQLRPRLTLRAGYQATFTDSIATPVSNFQNDLDIVRLGPSFIDTQDSVIYHGPVLGIQWVR